MPVFAWKGPQASRPHDGKCQFKNLAILEMQIGNRDWLKPARIRTLLAP